MQTITMSLSAIDAVLTALVGDEKKNIISEMYVIVEAAEKRGREAGYQEGYTTGHDKGYELGYNHSDGDAYDEGYQEGFSDGQEAAYEDRDGITAGAFYDALDEHYAP